MNERWSFGLLVLSYKIRDRLRPRRKILEEGGFKPGDRVLDFGCGPGSYILPLSEMVAPGGEIYALDINPLAIRKIEDLVKRNQLTNVRTILSDGPTGLPDEFLDGVVLYDVFHDLKQPGLILRELHRVLKPGGILSFSDHHLKEGKIVSALTEANLFKLSRKGKFSYTFHKL